MIREFVARCAVMVIPVEVVPVTSPRPAGLSLRPGGTPDSTPLGGNLGITGGGPTGGAPGGPAGFCPSGSPVTRAMSAA